MTEQTAAFGIGGPVNERPRMGAKRTWCLVHQRLGGLRKCANSLVGGAQSRSEVSRICYIRNFSGEGDDADVLHDHACASAELTNQLRHILVHHGRPPLNTTRSAYVAKSRRSFALPTIDNVASLSGRLRGRTEHWCSHGPHDAGPTMPGGGLRGCVRWKQQFSCDDHKDYPRGTNFKRSASEFKPSAKRWRFLFCPASSRARL